LTYASAAPAIKFEEVSFRSIPTA